MESFSSSKVHLRRRRNEEKTLTVEGTPQHRQLSLFAFIGGLFEWLICSLQKLFLVNDTSQSANLPLSSLPTARSWNDLPDELVREIALKMHMDECIRMGSVCRSWDAVINLSEDTRRIMQMSVDSKMPWLLQQHSPSTDSIHLYSLSEGKRYSFLKPKFMWESFCCGTSNGWLIMVDGSKFDPFMFMWNPLSAQIIGLPPLSTIPCYIKSLNRGVFKHETVSNFIKRVEIFTVSAGETEHVVVAAILGMMPFYGGKGQTLVLCTPEEDDEWTIIESDKDIEEYYDILFHDGMLYVVQGDRYNQEDEYEMEEEHQTGRFEVCTISLANCRVSLGLIHANAYPDMDAALDCEDDYELYRCLPYEVVLPAYAVAGWLYLAESTFGELLLITRTCALFGFSYGGDMPKDRMYIHKETCDFKVEVIKFENDKSLFALTRCTSLDNQALFLGTYGAVAFDSEPDQDCIWFLPSELHTHDSLQSTDSGIFNLQDKSIKHCFPSIKAPLPSNLGWFTPKVL